MKHIRKNLTCLAITMFAFAAHANSYMGTGNGEYYFGANLQYLFIKPKAEYQDFLKAQQLGPDVYVGYRLNRVLGFEMGYGWTTRTSKDTNFVAGQTTLNNSLIIASPTNITGKIRYKTTHFDMNGYYPISKHIDGIVSVGVGFLRPSVNIALNGANPDQNLYNQVGNIAGKTNAMMRFGLGFEGMLGDYWGLRSIVRYENTRRTSVRNSGVGGSRILKDGVSVALGFYRYLD